MSEFDILSTQRPDREIVELMASEVASWWDNNKEQITILDKVFNETCTMDQLGFIHDKATGKLIAGSKLDWFHKMMGEDNFLMIWHIS